MFMNCLVLFLCYFLLPSSLYVSADQFLFHFYIYLDFPSIFAYLSFVFLVENA